MSIRKLCLISTWYLSVRVDYSCKKANIKPKQYLFVSLKQYRMCVYIMIKQKFKT